MSRRTRSALSSEEWPPHLRLLILAAERECPGGHASALTELMSLALTKVPARGIFDPTSGGEHELFAAIEAIAIRHLGMAEARTAWRRALGGARLELEARDRIEHAALQLQAVSDTTYFYAGLAFGLICASVFRASS
jgi:hypothetical protein